MPKPLTQEQAQFQELLLRAVADAEARTGKRPAKARIHSVAWVKLGQPMEVCGVQIWPDPNVPLDDLLLDA